jgi:WhiB family redox-sensing transcriptional regulator
MTRARVPRPHEVASARRDPRLLRAAVERQADTAWRTRGVCQNVDPETFFPAPTEAADQAMDMCSRCDVAGACLAWALDVGDCHGVWGGTTARERRAMVVAWRTPEQPEEAAYAEGLGTPAIPAQASPSRTVTPIRIRGPRRRVSV